MKKKGRNKNRKGKSEQIYYGEKKSKTYINNSHAVFRYLQLQSLRVEYFCFQITQPEWNGITLVTWFAVLCYSAILNTTETTHLPNMAVDSAFESSHYKANDQILWHCRSVS
jgi:hypothetical protein